MLLAAMTLANCRAASMCAGFLPGLAPQYTQILVRGVPLVATPFCGSEDATLSVVMTMLEVVGERIWSLVVGSCKGAAESTFKSGIDKITVCK
jgi:hypothetical protein